MNIKGIIILLFLLTIAGLSMVLSGCERVVSILPDSEMSQMINEEIPIGVVVPLTGQYAEPYGIPMQRGFELAREEINNAHLLDASLTFITVDDQSTVSGAMVAVQQLVDQGVPAIVGIALSIQLTDAFPIAQENGIVGFSSVSAAIGLSSIGDFIFRTPVAGDIQTSAGVTVTQEKLGSKKVAYIYDSDIFDETIREVLRNALEARGVEILTAQAFQTQTIDFSQQLTHIMDEKPDALFIYALAQEMTKIIIQGRAIGIPDSVHFLVPDLSKDEVQKTGDAAEGAITFTGWSSGSNTPGNQTFVENYRAKYGIEPEPWAAQSYATLYILAAAIQKAESTDSVAIRDALAQTMDLPTILGNFSFDPNGEAIYTPIVLIVKDGELQVFE